MGVTVLIGGQCGNEGKGKVIDLLAESVDLVIRAQGGNNAGHTVGGGATHTVPRGILSPHTLCVIGHGVIVDPRALLGEIDELHAQGVPTQNLIISERAHMVMPYHHILDTLDPRDRGDKRMGTTARGVRPAYSDKMQLTGFRIGDLLQWGFFEARLRSVLAQKNALLQSVHGAATLDEAAILEEYRGYAGRLRRYVRDVFPIVQEALDSDRRILIEGAQGVLLDIDLGAYPYVATSAPTTGGALTGSGIPWHHIDSVIGVFGAYTTRVDSGPMPTEMAESMAEHLRELGTEFDTLTGRARRMGWFDVPAARYVVKTQGIAAMALTKIDVLDSVPVIKVCTGYRFRGEVWAHPMANFSHMEDAEPVYAELRGWMTPTSRCQTYAELPTRCRDFVERVEELCGVPVDLVSVGPDRSQSLLRRSLITVDDDLVELDAQTEAILASSPN